MPCKTVSLWTDLQKDLARERGHLADDRLDLLRMLNPFYKPVTEPLRPSCNSKWLVFWRSYYLRYAIVCVQACPEMLGVWNIFFP